MPVRIEVIRAKPATAVSGAVPKLYMVVQNGRRVDAFLVKTRAVKLAAKLKKEEAKL